MNNKNAGLSDRRAVRSKPQRWGHRAVRSLELLVAVGVLAGVWTVATPLGGKRREDDLATARHRTPSPVSAAKGPLQVVSVAPPANATDVSPTATVTVTFSQPLATSTPFPKFTPPVRGRWRRTSAKVITFRPAGATLPMTTETITIPAGRSGIRALNGSLLASSVVQHWQVRTGSVLRLQQVLAQLHYLPLNWTASSTASSGSVRALVSSLYHPPAGSFTWRYTSTPASLVANWQPGVANRMTRGAIVAFERHNGLPAYTSIRPQLWDAVLKAEERPVANPDGYTYAMVSENEPESLTLWHDGRVVYTSVANTGIASTPTPTGTYFVYLRYASQTMRGTNPDGTYYIDHGVRWVNYFDGSDAIHGFIRSSYGFPQSLGCVELPVANAAVAWKWIHYGTLVTIAPAGQSPAGPTGA